MQQPDWSKTPLHVIVKPTGPICNLRCGYCFYLEKEALYPDERQWRMTAETLETYLRQYIAAQPEGDDPIDFAFQGGEPTLMGLDFFRRFIELERKYLPPGRRFQNSLQTNGMLLDDAWCELLRENRFLVGLSLDGPADLHDAYRRDKAGSPSFDRVMQSVRRLQRHGVEFNVLACVHRRNGDHPARVYNFLRDIGASFIQFIPIVRRQEGLQPGGTKRRRPEEMVTPWSVLPKQFGRFLTGVFDLWIRRDVGRLFVRDFDEALAAWTGKGANVCVYQQRCGRAVALEHNGDLYCCDHFVEPDCLLGNIHRQAIAELANSSQQEQFGEQKLLSLPDVCGVCRFRFACHGGCPKDRFLDTAEGLPGLNYLCEGLKMFFSHVEPHMDAMTAELKGGGTAGAVMRRLRAQEWQARRTFSAGPVSRNAPCPCGSGRKFKNCCLRE